MPSDYGNKNPGVTISMSFLDPKRKKRKEEEDEENNTMSYSEAAKKRLAKNQKG